MDTSTIESCMYTGRQSIELRYRTVRLHANVRSREYRYSTFVANTRGYRMLIEFFLLPWSQSIHGGPGTWQPCDVHGFCAVCGERPCVLNLTWLPIFRCLEGWIDYCMSTILLYKLKLNLRWIPHHLTNIIWIILLLVINSLYVLLESKVITLNV
jgi:hypothetical protein